MLTINEENEDGVSVCVLRGRLDGNTSDEADQYLQQWEGKETRDGLIFDLSELDYLSSAGLRIFLMCAKRAKSQNRKIALAAPSDTVKQVLTISGFAAILEIFPDRASAAKALVQ